MRPWPHSGKPFPQRPRSRSENRDACDTDVVALSVDTSRALRGTRDLRLLVDAIVAATDHDEADWIEWKSGLDLTTKEGCFPIARTVLGMANRLPERASATCEGLGFIVVGVEPGNLPGIASVDPARLDQLVEPYVGGSEGPRWTPTYVIADDKTVLVVSVEAPHPGDRIFTLRKEFDRYRSGTVFVRKHGRTLQADAGDLDALQNRLTTAPRVTGAALGVQVVGDVPLSWIDPETTRPAIERWANGRRDELIAQARAVERSRQQPEEAEELDLTGLTGLQASMAVIAEQQDSLRRLMHQASALGSYLQEEDTRTIEEYIEQVDRWRDRLIEASFEALPGACVGCGHGVVALEVENLGNRFLPDVELEVRFEFEGATGFDEAPRKLGLPGPPRAFGKPKPRADLLSAGLLAPAISPPYIRNLGEVPRRTWVEEGSIVVKFEIGDLRQQASDTSDEVYIFLNQRPENGVLHATWKATVRDVDGLLTGTIDLPVREEAVEIIDVLLSDESE